VCIMFILSFIDTHVCYVLNRCSSGVEGLKEQGVTNYITLTFIMKYDVLFLEPDETSPHSADFNLVSSSVYQHYCTGTVVTLCWHFNLPFIMCVLEN